MEDAAQAHQDHDPVSPVARRAAGVAAALVAAVMLVFLCGPFHGNVTGFFRIGDVRDFRVHLEHLPEFARLGAGALLDQRDLLGDGYDAAAGVGRNAQRRREVGVRVGIHGQHLAATLRQQLELTGQLDWLELPYHRGIIDGTLPLSIGGGIGQARTLMLLLHKAHLGEVSVTVWPQVLKDMCAARGIHVLE